MMDCKKALERDRRRHRDAPRTGCARRASPARRSAPAASADQGAIDVRRRRQRRRARRAQLRDRLRRQGRRLQARARRRSRKLVVDEGDADLGAQADRRRDGRRLRQAARRARSARRSSSAGSSASRPTDGLLDGYKHIQNERGTIGVLVELGGVDPPTPRPARSRTTSPCTSPAPRPATSPATTSRPTRSSASATILEAQTRERGQARAGAGPRSSRASSTASTRTGRAASSSRSSRTTKPTIGALVDGARRRCHRAPLRPGQDRRGVDAPDRRTKGAADDREPVPPSGAQALG